MSGFTGSILTNSGQPIPDPIGANSAGAYNSTNAPPFGASDTSVAGIHQDDSAYTFNLASTITFANVGSAMAVDLTAANQMKLAGPGDIVVGQLMTYEPRTLTGTIIGTVMLAGGLILPLDTTAGAVLPAVGDSVQGGTVPGTVVKLAAAQGRSNFVTQVNLTKMVAVALFS